MWKIFTQQLWELQQVKVLWKCFYTRKNYTLADWNHILSIRTYWGGKSNSKPAHRSVFKTNISILLQLNRIAAYGMDEAGNIPGSHPVPHSHLRKSLLGQVAQGCSFNKLIFHPFPQNMTHLHVTEVLRCFWNKHWWSGLWICYSVRFIGTSSLSIYLGIYWVMPTATAVQGSREILGSFKDLFPKYQWNHEEWVVLDGLHKAQSGHIYECSFLVQFHGSVLSFYCSSVSLSLWGSAGQPKATAWMGRFLQMPTWYHLTPC